MEGREKLPISFQERQAIIFTFRSWVDFDSLAYSTVERPDFSLLHVGILLSPHLLLSLLVLP